MLYKMNGNTQVIFWARTSAEFNFCHSIAQDGVTGKGLKLQKFGCDSLSWQNLFVTLFGKIRLNSISMNVECTAKFFNDSKLIFNVPKQVRETQPMVILIIVLLVDRECWIFSTSNQILKLNQLWAKHCNTAMAVSFFKGRQNYLYPICRAKHIRISSWLKYLAHPWYKNLSNSRMAKQRSQETIKQ